MILFTFFDQTLRSTFVISLHLGKINLKVLSVLRKLHVDPAHFKVFVTRLVIWYDGAFYNMYANLITSTMHMYHLEFY